MRSIHVLLILLISTTLSAQISHGGEPMDWGRLQVGQELLPTLRLAPIDLTEVIREDSLFDQDKTAGYRFGVEKVVDVDLLASADLEIGSDGSRIYRYAVESQGALSLSFLLTEFHIVEGGRLYLWTAERERYLGAYTSENNKPGGMFPIGMINSDKVIFEYHHPSFAQMNSTMRLIEVVHGYRPILVDLGSDERGPFGTSGACNMNVLCPRGFQHIEQIRSVGLMVSGGTAFCSGALIANTTGDDTPYFLTADHCLNGSAGDDPTAWLIYFRHQSSACMGNDGPIDYSLAGAELLLRNTQSDVALIRLSNVPPESFAPYYAGWNSSTSSSITARTYSIHHPRGDVKKISFDDDPPTFRTSSGALLWEVGDWEDGVTEGGSSGGPLFSEEGHIIGQLFGGTAACEGTGTNGGFDIYGRFGVSYPFIAEWLDPDGLAEGQSFDGYYIYEDTLPIILEPEPFEFKLVPSMTNGVFNFRYNQPASFDISVYDIRGGLVLDATTTDTLTYRNEYPVLMTSGSDQISHSIDLRGIVPKGIYIFSLSGPLGNYTIRGAYVKD